ncbi:MAG: hypothetical protein LLG05_18885 [Porphyromonadaceae bacterium]|nr:hypothetical protein [Porphyromonadaceae bacterium]
MKLEYQYLSFIEVSNPKGKTRIFECRNKNSQTVLGMVKWYGAWRQYCYSPTVQAVYSAGCLDDMSDFIKQLKDS